MHIRNYLAAFAMLLLLPAAGTVRGDQTGISAETASTTPGEAGVRGVAGSNGPTINSAAGVFGTSSDRRGVIGSSETNDGILGFSTSGVGVNGQSVSGIGVQAFSSSGIALDVIGDADVSGDVTVAGMIVNQMAPIALGYIRSTGLKSVGSANVSSTFNASSSWYEITISGFSYFYLDYVTVVTPGCAGYSARTSSVSGKLLVMTYNSAGSFAQCDFQFVTYKP